MLDPSFDFVDTDVISETLKKAPDEAVLAWLVRNDAELAHGDDC